MMRDVLGYVWARVGINMTDHENNDEQKDVAADVKAILVVFAAAVLLAMHYVSGFSFDF